MTQKKVEDMGLRESQLKSSFVRLKELVARVEVLCRKPDRYVYEKKLDKKLKKLENYLQDLEILFSPPGEIPI